MSGSLRRRGADKTCRVSPHAGDSDRRPSLRQDSKLPILQEWITGQREEALGSQHTGSGAHARLPWRHRSCLWNALLHSPARGICATLSKAGVRPGARVFAAELPVWHSSADGPSSWFESLCHTALCSRPYLCIVTRGKALSYLPPPPQPPLIFIYCLLGMLPLVKGNT